jgi:hypothetical protein
MADYDRNRSRYDEENRGAFGYEGEGYLRGGGRDIEDRWHDNYRRPSFRGLGPKNYQRSDERIREDVCERLQWDEWVNATEIEVAVQNGVVTLSGSVDDRPTKRRAEDVAESVSGVKDVQNQIRVEREQS